MKILVLLIFLITISGCAQKVFNKPGASQQDFASDRYGCEKDSRQSGDFGGGIAGAMEVQNYFNRCMSAHGWELQGKAEQQSAFNQAQIRDTEIGRNNEIYASCLRAVRSDAKFSIISAHFGSADKGTFTVSQKADAGIPTVLEAKAYVAYIEQIDACRSTYIAQLTELSPSAGPLFLKQSASLDEVGARLGRRETSWGAAAVELQRSSDDLRESLSKLRSSS